MNSNLRVAVIGAGDHVAQSHAPFLNVVATVDPDPTHVIGNGSWFSTEEGLYESAVDFDAVVIGSPDRFHFGSIRLAASHGKHVFCEKPVCETAEQLVELADIISGLESRGLVFSSCHPRRFDPPYTFGQDNLPAMIGEYGEVTSVSISFHYPKSNKRNHSGLLADHLNHEVDYLNMLLGFSPVTVSTKVTDSQEKYCVVGAREDEVAFMFVGHRLSEPGPYQERYTIVFERGEISVDCHTGVVTGWNVDTVGTDYVIRNTGINQNFIDACGGNETCYLTSQEILENTQAGIRLL